jgi:hypothetical protein
MKINGKLSFDASSASKIENLRLETVSTLPTWSSADYGRLVFLTSNDTIYYGDVDSWMPVATGGNAFSATEGDNLEAALGSFINGSDGTFSNTFTASVGGVTGSETTLKDVIQHIATYVDGNNELIELDDVTLSSAYPLTGNKFLYNAGGSTWVDHTLVLADVSNVTSTAAEVNELHSAGAVQADFIKLHAVTADAAELNILDGATLSTTELNFVDGVTSSIQDQLDNKQPLNPGLTGLSTLLDGAGVGIIVQTGVDTVANRSLVQPSAGITISTSTGVAGNFTFALANDLAGVEGLSGTGYAVRTGDGTWTTRSLSVSSGQLVITGDAAGVTTDTTLGLATVTDNGTGTFLKFGTDSFGRVTGTEAVTTADITGLVDSQYLRLDGTTTMTGNINVGSHKIVSLATPTDATDAATKAYVDAALQGLSWKQAVVAATTGNITLSGTQTIDGVAVVAGDRVLVKNQTAAADNGIYVVAAGAWTRAVDMNVASEFDSSAVFVQQGTVNEGTGWTETATITTVGTDAVAFSQFSGGQAFIWGVGLSNTGNTVFVNLGGGIAEKPTDSIGIDLYDEANSALILTTDGSTRESPVSDNGQLYLLLDAAGALAQTSAGLKIAANAVTNAMIENDTMTVNGDTGTGSLALGGTLEVKGDSVQGIVTSVNGTGTFTVTASTATASQLGVAKFSTGDFDVTSGNVTIKAGGVDNAQLAYSTITVAGTSGSDAVALGETLTFSSTVSGLVSSTVAANGVALDVRLADATNTGVASFNDTMFSVTAGAVSIDSTLGTVGLTNVASGVDTASNNDILVYNTTSSKWENHTPATVGGTIALGDLSDVGSASAATASRVLVADGTSWNATKMYHLHTAASATSWTVTHGLGQKYCVVTVVDADDEVVIPQSIKFDSNNQLTVTFNTAISGYCVVMGMA